MKVGEIVTRASYGDDIEFVIKTMKENEVVLEGVRYRLIADAYISDLHKVCKTSVPKTEVTLGSLGVAGQALRQELHEVKEKKMKNIKFGKVLHIDSNHEYLRESMLEYQKFNIPVIGVKLEEGKQAESIEGLLKKYNPNVVVITGHDSLGKKQRTSENIEDYLNSKYFVDAIKIARGYNPNYDQLVIIAGGCKSYYEALMKAGANFASSPGRCLIDIKEPVYIACKVSITSIRSMIDVEQIVREMYGTRGRFGGVETKGQSRGVIPLF